MTPTRESAAIANPNAHPLVNQSEAALVVAFSGPI
jgi:hypothetical protein